ncbi:putative activating signal cointegrator 1-like [Penaeus vannamei]|uniref:Activating signal cointegrator 1 n=1 Tax=Penaeus vannamei TaxID=6689 RepID=A0A423U383_PENVA|nr:putative activating signal cointegrator 1-like [Penaeus vannamei]
MASLEDWACAELDKLGIPDAGDIVRYLQPIEDPAEVEDYLASMLDKSNNSHQKFIKEFLRKQEEGKSAIDSRFYRKSTVEEDFGYKINDGKKKQKNNKENEDPVIKEILEGRTQDIFSAPDREESGPKIEVSRPEYTSSGITGNKKQKGGKFQTAGNSLRVQDRELLEMTDEGKCLSMHQPWASLLVAGIKVHEGRMWYSSHRGRLWIAAAAKVPTPEEIQQLEHMYRVLLKDEYLQFPKHYPTGCLLGCVDVVDVLPQEEYRTQFPEGESDSPYVFVCESPQEMILKFPIKGDHKIYKLDPKIHQAAKKALRPREE